MAAYRTFRDEVINQPVEILKLSVPSLLYTIQNNLLYYALSHLDAATFQVGYQVKILTTAVFSVFMLGKQLSTLQWISLVILTAGVSMAQLSTLNSNDHKANTTAGFIAVLLAACTSGFSGVYFERILKNSATSLWVRNIQMGLGSVLLGLLGVYLSGEYMGVMENGFFYGYTHIVVAVIFLQGLGGLVVAVVVKYADNILKGFAASFSIVTSCILSYFVFDFHPNLMFLIGAVLVNISMYMYSQLPKQLKDKERSGEEQQPLIAATGINTDTNISAMERGGGGGGGGEGGGTSSSGGAMSSSSSSGTGTGGSMTNSSSSAIGAGAASGPTGMVMLGTSEGASSISTSATSPGTRNRL